MDASLGKIRYDIPTSVIVLLQLISMLVSPRHDSPIAANDASVSWEHRLILIDCRWMHPWTWYDIPTSVISLLQLISMLVSPRHDSPIAAKPMMHLSAESMILQYWLTGDGCIPGQDTIYQHLSSYCYHSYQCLSVPGMTLLSQPSQWCICQLITVSNIDWL